MYPVALDCGVPCDKYWDLTLQEIKDSIDSCNRVAETEKRSHIDEMFVLAEVIANRVLNGLAGEKDESAFVQPWDYYPDLFEGYAEKMQEERELQKEEVLKARLLARAEAWNARFEEEGQNGS